MPQHLERGQGTTAWSRYTSTACCWPHMLDHRHTYERFKPCSCLWRCCLRTLLRPLTQLVDDLAKHQNRFGLVRDRLSTYFRTKRQIKRLPKDHHNVLRECRRLTARGAARVIRLQTHPIDSRVALQRLHAERTAKRLRRGPGGDIGRASRGHRPLEASALLHQFQSAFHGPQRTPIGWPVIRAALFCGSWNLAKSARAPTLGLPLCTAVTEQGATHRRVHT